MLKRLGPLPRFVLGMAMLVVLLAATAGLWWKPPPWPLQRWQTPAPLEHVWLSPSGRTLVAIHADAEDSGLTVWDTSSGRLRAALPAVYMDMRRRFGARLEGGIWMSPDETVLVYPWEVGGSPRLRVWDLVAGRERFTLEGLAPLAHVLPDGDTVLRWDDTLFSLTNGKPRPLPAELVELVQDQWTFDDTNAAGQRVLLRREVGGWTYSVAVWDFSAATFRLPPLVCTKAGSTRGGFLYQFIDLDPTGSLLALTNGPATDLWDVTAGRKIASLRESGRWLVPRQFSPEGSRLVLLSVTQPYLPTVEEVTMEVWDVATNPPTRVGSGASSSSIFSRDGKVLFSPPTGEFRDTTTWKQRPVGIHFPASASPVFSSDSRLIVGPRTHNAPGVSWLPSWVPYQFAAGTYLEMVEVDTGHEHFSLFRGTDSERLSPDWDIRRLPAGDQLFTYDRHGEISVWDLPPRRPWWIEYGLPVVFMLLLLLGVRLVSLAIRRKAAEAAPC